MVRNGGAGCFFTIDKKTNEVLLNDCYGADKHIQKIINVLKKIYNKGE